MAHKLKHISYQLLLILIISQSIDAMYLSYRHDNKKSISYAGPVTKDNILDYYDESNERLNTQGINDRRFQHSVAALRQSETEGQFDETEFFEESDEGEEEQDDPVSTVVVTAVRGSATWLPCDIGGGSGSHNNPLLSSPKNVNGVGEKGEDRAYMVLWFKYHSRQQSIRHHRNNKPNRLPSGGKPIYSFDIRGRPLASALKWSSEEQNGGFGSRALFVVFNGAGGLLERGMFSNSSDLWQRENGISLSYSEKETSVNYNKIGGAALRVVNITEQDGGAYRCRVDFKDAPTRNYRIILRVIVPPDKMSIAYDTGTLKADITEIDDDQNEVGPIPEGSSLVLTCIVRGGKPRPHVQWYSIVDSKKFIFNEIVNSVSDETFDSDGSLMTVKKLTIKQLNRNHANSSYMCSAGTEHVLESTLRRAVSINIYLNVQRVRVLKILSVESSAPVETMPNDNQEIDKKGLVQYNLVAGKWYTAECQSEGASPKANIQWTIDGNSTQIVTVDEAASQSATRLTIIKQSGDSSTIRLRPMPSDDGRYLRCRAWNPDVNTTNDNIIKSDAVLMNVLYPPIVKLSLGRTFDPRRIKTGDDVYFECAVSMNDGGGRGVKRNRNKIEWYHDGQPILQNSSSNSGSSDITNVLLSTGTLVIRNVNRRHSGKYTCQCSNELGIGRSRPVQLRVRYAPTCADENDSRRPKLVGVEGIGETNVHVTCRVRADPDDQVQFDWLVWPGAVSAGSAIGTASIHQHHHHYPNNQNTGASASMADSYVTTALSDTTKNDTAMTMIAYGQLVLKVSISHDSAQDIYMMDRANTMVSNHLKGSSNGESQVLNTVSCQATNSVGRQLMPCIYYLVRASAPSALTNCVVKMPKDHDLHYNQDSHRNQQNIDSRKSNNDSAIVSCNAGSDGGMNPVMYALEVYEGLLLISSYRNYGESITSDDYEQTRRRHNEWLVGNVTGVMVEDNRVEYTISRKLLQLKIGDSDNRRYLSLSAYAVNRMGRSPDVRIGGENTISLRHPWWWNGGNEEISTKIAISGTTSTEWWIMLGGGDNGVGGNRRNKNNYISGETATTGVVLITVGTIVVVFVLFLLLRKKGENRSLAVETTVSSNRMVINGNGETQCANGTSKKYSLLSQQQNVYPHLDLDGRHCDAPDVTIQQELNKPCFVSITNNGIPGPESCV
ncbi:uncharacterized protein LOC126897228 isoform X2 [Daktulosphaira vitifoliae]|nr:uncharacterized protein LOC126897228 isoform X2 [Daktulosphaira vitifoliae]